MKFQEILGLLVISSFTLLIADIVIMVAFQENEIVFKVTKIFGYIFTFILCACVVIMPFISNEEEL